MTETAIAEMKGSSTLNSLPPTSLIICSRNRPKLLLETIESVLQGNEVPTELIIVDQSNAPHPNLPTLSTDRACEIRYKWTRSSGVGWARNTGMAEARHDILALTDDDMSATSTWFNLLIQALLKAGPHSVVTGQVLPGEVEPSGGFAPSLKVDQEPAVYEGRPGKDVLYTGNMAMHRSVIDKIGVFDERLGPGTSFPAAEDNDFGFRLLQAGYRIIYIPEAILYHRAWRSESDYLPLQWNYGRGQGAFYAKHLSLTDRYMLRRMWSDVIHHTFMFCRRLQRQRYSAYCHGIFILGIFAGVIQWLLMQRRQSL